MTRWMSAASVLLLLPTILSAAPAKDEQAEAQAVLDRAIKAVGGEEKLTKMTGYVLKIRRISGPAQFSQEATITYQFPDRKRTEVTGGPGVGRITMLQVLNGDQGWFSAGGVVREMTKEQLAASKPDLYSDFAVRQLPLYKGRECKLAMLGDSKVEEKRAVGIKVSRKDRPDLTLFFDKDTGLLLKREYKIPVAPGTDTSKPIAGEVLYEDYKEADGIKYPSKITEFQGGNKISTNEIIEFKVVDKFDEKTFAKPE